MRQGPTGSDRVAGLLDKGSGAGHKVGTPQVTHNGEARQVSCDVGRPTRHRREKCDAHHPTRHGRTIGRKNGVQTRVNGPLVTRVF